MQVQYALLADDGDAASPSWPHLQGILHTCWLSIPDLGQKDHVVPRAADPVRQGLTHPLVSASMFGTCCSTSSQCEHQALAHAAESASVDPDGALVLASREGGIWRAPRGPDGSFQLEAQPFAKVSGGRPLGIHHDKDGNLIICTAGKVGSFWHLLWVLVNLNPCHASAHS